ncbi:hypothetical protein DMENIID0001_160510 [Sergentomyia squamirostris]
MRIKLSPNFLRDLVTRSLRTDNAIQYDAGQDLPLLPFWKRKSYLVFLLTSIGFSISFLLRSSLTVTIIDMTSVKRVILSNGSEIETPEFDWTSQQQGLILSSFFYGNVITHLLGGFICTKIAGNYVLAFGVGATAVLCLLTELVAREGYLPLVGLRVLEGLLEGPSTSSILAIATRWVPIEERARMTSLVLLGVYLGSITPLPIAGTLIVHLGWQSVFYIFGIIGIIWTAVYLQVVKSGPELDPHISQQEKSFILQRLESNDDYSKYPIPWKGIFTSVPVAAICIMCFCQAYGSATFVLGLPRFFTEIMGADIELAGILAAIPIGFMCLSFPFSGIIIDLIIKHNILSISNARRYIILIVYLLEGTCVVIASQMISSVTWFMVILSFGFLLEPLGISSYTVNIADLCPVSAPVIHAVVSFFGGIGGALAPLIIGYLTPNHTTEQWQIVFYTVTLSYILGSTIFCLFSKAELQPWSPVKNNNVNNTNIP